MERNGEPIDNFPITGAVHPGISYSLRYLEYEACVAAGCDLWKWDNGEYPPSFRARVVAWYELTKAIEINVSDAQTKEAKRRSTHRG